jgi:1-acyl-sn-glycerol-3-phosphate acyltransferase
MKAMIRTIFFWITMVVSLLILCPIIFVFQSSDRVIQALQQGWGRLHLWVSGAKVEMRGVEHIDLSRTYIMMANHQSYHDIFVVSTIPLYAHWMAKQELFRIPVFGWILRWIGAMRIDRSSKLKTIASVREAVEQIRQGRTVLIFPEGTRSPNGVLLPFNKGAFSLAILAQAPILPITIDGTRSILAKDSYLVRPGVVKVTIDPPIETASLGAKDKDRLQEKVYACIQANLTGKSGAQPSQG